MTKPVHTTPPPDAPARRRAQPVLTYSVEQLPSLDTAFYNRARAEVSKVAELTVPPREAKALGVSAGHLFRIVSVEGPQVVYPQDILAATVHAVRAALGGLKGGLKPPMASPSELATAIRSADYLARDARWPDPK